MADSKKMYEVIGNKRGKYTGKHRVYSKGALIPESEIFGNKDVILNGQKESKDSDGKITAAIKPVLKVATAAKIEASKAGK